MPEPVVIIGPAHGPAGPSAEPDSDGADTPAAETGIEPERRKGKQSMLMHGLAGLSAGLLGVLVRLFRAVGTLGVGIVRRYPRHSLAAGASVVILGAIWYSEIGGRRPVANQIAATSSTDLKKDASNNAIIPDAKNTAGSPADGGTASPAKIATTGSGEGGAVKPVGNAPAPAGPTAPQATPAPAPTVAAKDDPAPAPTVAAKDDPTPAPTVTAKDDPAPAPTVVANDDPASALPSLPPASAGGNLATAAKPEPAPSPASTLDPSTPSLLASVVTDPAPALPPAGTDENKAKGNAVKPAPTVEPPAPIGVLTPSPTPPVEGPPSPAPTAEAVQLATGLDEKNKPAPGSNPPNQPSSGDVSPPAAAVAGAANAEIKPKDTPAVSEPKSVDKSADASKSGSTAPQQETTASKSIEKPADALKPATVAQSIQPLVQPEPTKNDTVKPDLTPHESAKVQEPAPVAASPTDKPNDPPAVLATPAPALTEAKPTDAAKPAVDSPTSQLEPPAVNPAAQAVVNLPAPAALAPAATAALLDPHLSIPDSKPQVAESKPEIDTKPETDHHAAQPGLQAASPDPHGSDAKPAQPEASAKASRDLARDGWVSVPNSGKIVMDDAPDVGAHRDDAGSGIGAAAAATRDVRAHTAKDVDFEPESLRTAATTNSEQNGRRSAVAFGTGGELRSPTGAGRVEPTAHVVEPNENFWTISRLYYSSGRYYRALWKANVDKYPKIDKLKVNNVIVVPAVEDLDPEYIDPPRTTAPASLGTARRSIGRLRGGDDSNAEGAAQPSSSDAIDEKPLATARTNRGSADAVPVRRSSRTDPDLDLPAPDAVSRRASDPDHTGRPIHRPLGDDDATIDEPQARTTARPRTTSAASRRPPGYKVRQYDTLRSIARDMLGDSHRAGEILDLNRDLIDDPTHLTIGQMLELPDDARTSVRRSASR